MGCPLGPVLANIFLGYCESLISEKQWPMMYRRFVDDTFSIFEGRSKALEFLNSLNEIHPSLNFTMENEQDNRLPFMDVLVIREETGLSTTIYRKPTFTGLYTRWDSYCSTDQKISLIRSLTNRAMKICSPKYLGEEIMKLKSIFGKNGYPQPIVNRVIDQTLHQKAPAATVELKPVYLRLPWLGAASSAFRNRISSLTTKAVPFCKLICCFTSRAMFRTSKKDVLSAEYLSNVIYLFDCACGRSYVGRTSQRLGERMKQHVPDDLAQLATNPDVTPVRRKPGRPKRSVCVTSNAAPVSARTLRSNSGGGVKAEPLRAVQMDGSTSLSASVIAAGTHLVARKSDSAITRHLKESPMCLMEIGKDVVEHFKILARGRTQVHLGVLEAIFISRRKPTLCAQKEFLRTLQLF